MYLKGKRSELGMVVQASSLSTQQTEAGGPRVHFQGLRLA